MLQPLVFKIKKKQLTRPEPMSTIRLQLVWQTTLLTREAIHETSCHFFGVMPLAMYVSTGVGDMFRTCSRPRVKDDAFDKKL